MEGDWGREKDGWGVVIQLGSCSKMVTSADNKVKCTTTVVLLLYVAMTLLCHFLLSIPQICVHSMAKCDAVIPLMATSADEWQVPTSIGSVAWFKQTGRPAPWHLYFIPCSCPHIHTDSKGKHYMNQIPSFSLQLCVYKLNSR